MTRDPCDPCATGVPRVPVLAAAHLALRLAAGRLVLGLRAARQGVHHDGHHVLVDAEDAHQVRVLEEHVVVHQRPAGGRWGHGSAEGVGGSGTGRWSSDYLRSVTRVSGRGHSGQHKFYRRGQRSQSVARIRDRGHRSYIDRSPSLDTKLRAMWI